MKVLVLGSQGQVGRAVLACAPAGLLVNGLSRHELDLTDTAAVAGHLQRHPADWIINCAAYTAVDAAEDDLAQATLANDAAVAGLADAARVAGSRLLHISTDFVFDGTAGRAYLPSDPVNPLSAYGRTKLGGERHALAGNGIVVRTAWVYASAGKNFVLTMLRLMRERPEVRVVADQIGAPTWASGLAQAIWGLVGAPASAGLYHWTDLGVASWYDFAVAIQEEALARGLLTRAVPVIPIATADYPTKATRPGFSVLDTSSTRAIAAVPANHWRVNLRQMLDELQAP